MKIGVKNDGAWPVVGSHREITSKRFRCYSRFTIDNRTISDSKRNRYSKLGRIVLSSIVSDRDKDRINPEKVKPSLRKSQEKDQRRGFRVINERF